MKSRSWFIKIIVISMLVLIAIFFVINYLIWLNYKGKIYPYTKIGVLNMGGLSLKQAKNILDQKINNIETNGIDFKHQNKTINLSTSVVAFDSDMSYSIISFNINKTLALLYGDKEERTFSNYLINHVFLSQEKTVSAVYNLDWLRVKKFLDNNFSELNILPQNAYFSINKKQKLQKNLERIGKRINYQQAQKKLENRLAKLEDKAINLYTNSEYPLIKKEDLNYLDKKVESIVARGNLILGRPETKNNDSSKYWLVRPNVFITWISVKRNKDQINLFFNLDKIKNYLETNISSQIKKAAILPRFKIKNNKVVDWQLGKDGYKLNLDASAIKITKEFFTGKNKINLVIDKIPAKNPDDKINLNIKEIIGTGHSSFIGSPANRRHNIAVGANALQGLLIKPGEEFSLIKSLGEIDDKSGYLQELVIKDNKTIPEFGGGLCQIATTIFRATLSSGLPITMRQNHSYRVSYYEPAGTDATIYDPLPDFRFINDTGNYILIQSRIDKNNLYFDFWGTSDGRVATTSKPVIYNIVKPKPTKIIKTTELKPGEKKCTEHSHNGADAYFDYKVIYPKNSTTSPIHKRRFKSHYVPWQAVCLVGEQASSTALKTRTQK